MATGHTSDSRTKAVDGRSRTRKWPRGGLLLPLSLMLSTAGGCAWDKFSLFTPPPAPAGPADSLVLNGDKLEADNLAEDDVSKDLAGARVLFQKGEYAKAEKLFHRVAENKKNSATLAEEAVYYEAECLRLQKKYPRAGDTYNRLFSADFPGGVYREQALQHMFEIADYWLEDTRAEMERNKETKDNKRWFVMPTVFHFEDTKPFIDEEGRALEKLEQVRYNDITGPLAPKALFLAGSVKFYREDYREADHYFSQLAEMHPNSDLASRAVELAIISKHMSTGGAAYDGRKVAEARQLVHTALRCYPDLASQKGDFLERQLVGINMQQAEKDYLVADFYKRTGHPGSAYFYFEIVRRRYPGTKYFDLATEQMCALREKVEKEQGQVAAAPPTGTEGAATPDRPKPTTNEAAPPPRRVQPTPSQLPEITDEQAPPPRPVPKGSN